MVADVTHICMSCQLGRRRSIFLMNNRVILSEILCWNPFRVSVRLPDTTRIGLRVSLTWMQNKTRTEIFTVKGP